MNYKYKILPFVGLLFFSSFFNAQCMDTNNNSLLGKKTDLMLLLPLPLKQMVFAYANFNHLKCITLINSIFNCLNHDDSWSGVMASIEPTIFCSKNYTISAMTEEGASFYYYEYFLERINEHDIWQTYINEQEYDEYLNQQNKGKALLVTLAGKKIFFCTEKHFTSWDYRFSEQEEYILATLYDDIKIARASHNSSLKEVIKNIDLPDFNKYTLSEVTSAIRVLEMLFSPCMLKEPSINEKTIYHKKYRKMITQNLKAACTCVNAIRRADKLVLYDFVHKIAKKHAIKLNKIIEKKL